MILADAATDAAANATTINAAWIALGGLIAGVTLTVIGGLIGAWLQNRREHKRWVREKRLDAYMRAMRLAYELLNLHSEYARVQERIAAGSATDADVASAEAQMERVREAMNDMAAPLSILGPHSVEGALIEAGSHTDDMEEFLPRYRILVKQMRIALGIKG